MFYNTGIATYAWGLTNRKPAHRQGKVQLIDATQWFKPLRTLEEIRADIEALERETDGLLQDVLINVG
jgi:type I restriction-modification system DNA methylase subunit